MKLTYQQIVNSGIKKIVKKLFFTLLFFTINSCGQKSHGVLSLDIIRAEEPNEIPSTYKPEYLFKIKYDNNFKEALNSIKDKPNKFLIVVRETSNPDSYNYYLEFIKSYVLETQKHMYDKYVTEFDRYEFCFIGKEDSDFSFEYNQNQSPLIAYYNSTGECLYYLERPIEKEKNFYEWDTLYRDLINANLFVASDKIFDDSSSGVKDLKSAFKMANEIFYWDNQGGLFNDKTEIIINYYNYLDEAKQGYKLKANQDLVLKQWTKLLHSTTEIDSVMITLMFDELSREGFSKKIFKNTSKLLRDDDFISLDYLIKNYKIIKQKNAEDFNFLYMQERLLPYKISDPLEDCINEENNPSKELVNKVKSYLKRFEEVK